MHASVNQIKKENPWISLLSPSMGPPSSLAGSADAHHRSSGPPSIGSSTGRGHGSTIRRGPATGFGSPEAVAVGSIARRRRYPKFVPKATTADADAIAKATMEVEKAKWDEAN